MKKTAKLVPVGYGKNCEVDDLDAMIDIVNRHHEEVKAQRARKVQRRKERIYRSLDVALDAAILVCSIIGLAVIISVLFL